MIQATATSQRSATARKAVRRSSLLPFAILVLLPLNSGCGQDSDAVSVHGRVTYRGEPVSNAAVTFFPEKGRPVSVPLTAQGEYATQLVPGDYRMVVTVGTELPPGYKEGDPLPPPKITLPDHYTIRAKTSLHATVIPDQSEPLDIDLL